RTSRLRSATFARGADANEYLGLLGQVQEKTLAHVDRFAEPDDVGPQLTGTPRANVAERNRLVLGGAEVAVILGEADRLVPFTFAKADAAMQVPDVLAAGPLQQVVDVLGDVEHM